MKCAAEHYLIISEIQDFEVYKYNQTYRGREYSEHRSTSTKSSRFVHLQSSYSSRTSVEVFLVQHMYGEYTSRMRH